MDMMQEYPLQRETCEEHVRQQKKLAVIIDDSATVRKIVKTCLSREGVDVKGFQDGLEAMTWLAGVAARVPDLILLDVGLPSLNGYHVACHLRKKPPLNQAVIIMLSRRDDAIERLKNLLIGAQGVLIKPFRTCDLLAGVNPFLLHTNSESLTERKEREHTTLSGR